jgi:hypothetical protein
VKILAPTGARTLTPGPARSQFLYLLRYSGPNSSNKKLLPVFVFAYSEVACNRRALNVYN